MFNVFPPETSRLLELLEFYNLTSVPLLGIKNNASLMALSTVAFNSVMKSMSKTKIQCNFFNVAEGRAFNQRPGWKWSALLSCGPRIIDYRSSLMDGNFKENCAR